MDVPCQQSSTSKLLAGFCSSFADQTGSFESRPLSVARLASRRRLYSSAVSVSISSASKSAFIKSSSLRRGEALESVNVPEEALLEGHCRFWYLAWNECRRWPVCIGRVARREMHDDSRATELSRIASVLELFAQDRFRDERMYFGRGPRSPREAGNPRRSATLGSECARSQALAASGRPQCTTDVLDPRFVLSSRCQ